MAVIAELVVVAVEAAKVVVVVVWVVTAGDVVLIISYFVHRHQIKPAHIDRIRDCCQFGW